MARATVWLWNVHAVIYEQNSGSKVFAINSFFCKPHHLRCLPWHQPIIALIMGNNIVELLHLLVLCAQALGFDMSNLKRIQSWNHFPFFAKKKHLPGDEQLPGGTDKLSA